MRLTFRTLLAYMDDILDPSDQEELTEKIETSEFATDLIHRTRDTMRRLRLSAPQPLGSGLGLDPNTVAEYLDNTLTPENVADLERICLESDVHLAEAASCHHVLTMVLGEPAEIDPESRQRMYAIAGESAAPRQSAVDGADGAASHSSNTPAGAESAAHDAGAAERSTAHGATTAVSNAHEVPDYLRASRWSPAGVGAALLAVAAAVLAMVYFGTDVFDRPTPDEVAQADRQPADSEPDAGADQPDDSAASGTGDSASETAVTTPESTAPDGESPPPDVSVPVTPLTEVAPLVPALPADPLQAEPMAPSDAEVAVDEPILRNDAEATTDSPDPPEVADDGEAAGEGEAEVAEEQADPPPPAELGTFWADRDVLLRYDEQAADWFPLPTGTTIEAGDRLLTLPTFRPTVAMREGIGIRLTGASSIVLTDVGPQYEAARGLPTMFIVFGRVVLINSGESTKELNIVVGEAEGTVQLGSDAMIAFDVDRNFVPGRDPLEEPAPVEASVYAPDGNLTWIIDGQEREVEGPKQWEIITGQPIEAVELTDNIDWIFGTQVDRLEQGAADRIRNRLDPDMPAAMTLLDVSKSRRREEQALATRCSAYVGQFVPFVGALHDSDQRSSWELHIQTLREAMALSPESAATVRRTLFEQRGAEAAEDMFEMLRGYSLEEIGVTPEERQTGALDRLINWLESDSLDYRVLAAHNLKEITGKELLRNPAANPDDRARGVRQWRQRLRNRELEPVDIFNQ